MKAETAPAAPKSKKQEEKPFFMILNSHVPFANDFVTISRLVKQLWQKNFRICNSSHYILWCVA